MKPAVIMLCETFTRLDISKAFLTLDGYELVVRKDGTDTNSGIARGLLIYCRLDLNATELEDPCMNNFIECAGIQLPLGDQKTGGKSVDILNLILVYRPPRQPFSVSDSGNTEKLCFMLKSLKGKDLVVGDFNLPGIDWHMLQ